MIRAQERVRVAQKLRELVLKFTGQSAIEEQRVFTFAFRRWGLSNPFAVDHSDSTAADVAFHRFTPTKCELEMDRARAPVSYSVALRLRCRRR